VNSLTMFDPFVTAENEDNSQQSEQLPKSFRQAELRITAEMFE
jgi:hypothetical protein